MSMDPSGWLSALADPGSALLPTAGLLRLYLPASWGLVLVSLLAGASGAWPKRVRWAAMGVLAVWCFVPGPASPTFWLGLAFQMPSISMVLLCGWLLVKQLLPAEPAVSSVGHKPRTSTLVLAAGGVALGWLLLLDTFALLPFQLYAWGFGPAASTLALAVLLLPWVFAGAGRSTRVLLAVAPVSVLLFVATRLPNGNVWNALLDPWLWAALHVLLVKRLWQRKKEPFLL
jgi:hypothetical protein